MATALAPSLPLFNGLRPHRSTSNVNSLQAVVLPSKRRGGGALGARCDFIGSSTNLIMVTTTSLMLFAGRFGLAPSANRKATAGLKLEARDSGLQTGDPAGFTLADTLACGTVGHIIGVGVVLGLKNLGAL
ncbi:hypothetical protein Nepgr_022653 [Nepenthes gracilis]|uniref:Photosystem I reaction center subunit psaK, chloroplastic n=1 Tax=Nepenthes gracilis TaxID=150966 RepID=A0AAD3T2Z8_NEPGR|nr:hypothetical protein Nepgr_022653 [Nepenthes gracilis]